MRVYFISKDVYSCLHSLVERCISAGILPANIYLVNQGTTSDECKKVYESLVLRGVNCVTVPLRYQAFGPYVIWHTESDFTLSPRNDYPYIVSDTDLQFPDCYPSDWLESMFFSLNRFRFIPKISLPLRIHDIDTDNRSKIVEHEQSLGRSNLYLALSYWLNCPHDQRMCQTDTTFSLYRPNVGFSTLSIRLESKYELLHMPWYKRFANSQEYGYYKNNKDPRFGMWSS